MTMQFLEIRSGQDGLEYAYLFDTTRNVVIRTPVEDFASESVPVQPRRRRVRVVEEPQEEYEDEPLPVQRKVAPRNIMPPHLRAALLPPETPGAATETRMV